MIRWAHLLLIIAALALLSAVTVEAMRSEPAGEIITPPGRRPAGHPGGSMAPGAKPGPQTHVLNPVPQDRKAPAFALSDRDGKNKTLAQFSGQFVLLNFWATWCEPCKDELPHLATMAQALKELGIKIVLVSVNEKLTEVEILAKEIDRLAGKSQQPQVWQTTAAMLRDKVPNVVNLHDPKASVPKAYGTAKYPETFLISPKGQIVTHFVGPKAWASPQAISYIKDKVSGKEPKVHARMPHPPGGPGGMAPAGQPQLPKNHPPLPAQQPTAPHPPLGPSK